MAHSGLMTSSHKIPASGCLYEELSSSQASFLKKIAIQQSLETAVFEKDAMKELISMRIAKILNLDVMVKARGDFYNISSSKLRFP